MSHPIEKRRLGKTGLEVTVFGFGCIKFPHISAEQAAAALDHAIDLGVNFIDTAAGYGDGKSERLIAQVLKQRSERVYVATKTPPLPGNWPPGPYDIAEERYPERYLRENVEERLRNLQTDRIDLLQLHTWTRAWNKNPRPFAVLRKLQSKTRTVSSTSCAKVMST
jgi:aryl-alcohol dehydrogenase-like predicted oxidoreductase